MYAFPLSFGQRRLWFLDQLSPGNGFYNIPAALRFSFPLSVAVLQRSLTEIVRRHEGLRVTFQVIDGEPAQVVAPPFELALPTTDLRSLPAAEREARALQLATEEARLPFDLTRGPLIRTSLLQLGDADWIFLLTVHHIVSDGWSNLVFSKELTALYGALALGRPSPLPELPLQYVDYALWQHDFLQGDRLEQELAWWRERLAGAGPLQLLTDRPRPPVATYEGATIRLTLPAALCSGLRSLARRSGATLFMTCLAGFQALLHRYSGQEDIVLGIPVAGRDRAEIEDLIGFFVNTVVLRTEVSSDLTFRELLTRVIKASTDAFAHQQVPFEKLVEELQPERDLSRNPLCQVVFQLFSNLAAPGAGAGAAAGSSLNVERGASVFDLACNLWEGPAEIAMQIDYSTALFNAGTIERLAKAYRSLLEGAVAHPDAPLWQLPLLSPGERRLVVHEWNQTATDYPRESSVPALFEEIVRATPDAVALETADGKELTYRELDARANTLAQRLLATDVVAGTLVGVCLPRGVDLIVALLAVLKAGAAYVPLDPAYPAERLQFMIEDSGVPVIVTTETEAGRLRPGAARLLCLDGAPQETTAADAGRLPGRVAAEAVAYVMYTSGSTGKPKGTTIAHRGIVRLVRGTNYADLSSREVFLQLAPSSFDASTFEIWAALLNGTRLVLFPPHLPSLEELADFIRTRGVTTLFLTSSLFQQMVMGPIDGLRNVRQLITGGDVVPVAPVRKLLSHFPECKLIAAYGPTENSAFTTCFPMTHPDQAAHSVAIGRPISNTQAYILDAHLQPVPIGVPGELFVGGDGVADGYHRRPELTAERFLPDPFRTEAGARLYRTGDRVRFREDGNIEFLGRMDQQVKIRGYRIEPAEVEAVLLAAPGVREVAVVARESADGDRRLVAYFVGDQVGLNGHGDGAASLRQFAQPRLPDFMVPAQFIRLEALPLNPSGKLDLRALPEPETARPGAKDFVAPRSETETQLAGLWEELLHVPRVGVHDHFFAELGGHSLRATQLVSRIREGFQIDLPLRSIFEAPTIADLALLVEDRLLSEIEGLVEDPAPVLLPS
ncbi:MAG TPA: amino acid adenylation domain-containing protein [Chthoniobacteraceae bacterium]|nr:amino acid adenylation domain-containing protein [Chthoniobacteraceae bacterium]